ncbi:SSI family serine proteinase inhibitor [Sphaerisporangium fuscum]|uniref:SSI family serine proteinase inhibitor n=1 Tax=Sphaerisporangium fuscum TaxID=2835868 RepID=UPI001BDC8064|nr:SSI family serine proteinase inhibitor [Sphaerisporangium fuscum]
MRSQRTFDRRGAWLARVALAGLVPLFGATPALASTSAAADPVGVYVLKVTPVSGGNSAPLSAGTLLCGPDGGTHADAARACDQLRRANGMVERIPEDPGMCTKEYAPVRLTATGVWNRQLREFTQTYPNLCTAVRATGGVLFAS